MASAGMMPNEGQGNKLFSLLPVEGFVSDCIMFICEC
jgi:hypothetical protein